MTHLRRLVSAVCLVSLCLSSSVCNSQTATGEPVAGSVIDQTTGNIITGAWTNTTPINTPGGLSGGYTAGFIQSDNNIVFGYTQSTVSQIQAVGQALSAAGTGIQVNGLNYSWQYFNEGMNRGNLSGQINLASPAGTVLQSYSFAMPKNPDGTGWVSQSGAETFTSPYQATQIGYLGVAFSGKDDRYWAGYYGPMVRHVDVRLRYGVDPCATNPAYSPNCTGFSSVVESPNLVPNPDAYGVFGSSVNNSFAINKAFEAAGTGMMVHGFKWGYVANANGAYCAMDMWIFGCWDFRIPSVSTSVNITNSAGASLYSVDRTYTNGYNTTNYSYLFPTSQQLGNLGSFNFTATTNDAAYVGQMWSKAIYTPDQCMVNPLSSPTCPGYYTALATQSATTTTTTTTTPDSSTQTATQPITSPTLVAGPAPGSTSSTQTADVTPVASTSTPQATSSSTTSSSVAISVTPTAINPQPKVGEISVAGSAPQSTSKSSSGGPSMSTILGIVGGEQSRISKVEQSVVQQATEQASTAAQQAQQQAESTAANAVANSNTASTATTVSSTSRITTQGSSNGILFPTPGSTSVVNATSQRQEQTQSYTQEAVVTQKPYQQLSTFQAAVPFQQYSQPVAQGISVGRSYQSSETVVSYSPSIGLTLPRPKQNETDYSKMEVSKLEDSNTFRDLLNPPRPQLPIDQQTKMTGPSVNQRAVDNDAAGSVTIASIAKQPAGYDMYMVSIKDTVFYAPKEIYRNQKTVDNMNVVRMLNAKSDALHQKMVESQYKKEE